MVNRQRYSTKFSKITLATGIEPEDYLRDKIKLNWLPMQIYHDLQNIARKYELPMVSERSVYSWIIRMKDNGQE